MSRVYATVTYDGATGAVRVEGPPTPPEVTLPREREALLRLRDLLDAAIPQVGPGELMRIVKRGLGEEVE